MVRICKFFTPLWSLFFFLLSCGKIDTPNVADPFANITGKSLGFDVDPPYFVNDANGNQVGLESAVPGACGNILLQWSPAHDAVTLDSNISYFIYQSTLSGGEDFNVPTYQTPADVVQFLVKNLSPGKTYYFVVRARDEAGNLSVIDPNHLVERFAPTMGERIPGGAGPNLYCPGGYAGETAVFTGTSVGSATTALFYSSSSQGNASIISLSSSEVRAVIPSNIQSGTVQLATSSSVIGTTADRFLFFPPGMNISTDTTSSANPSIAISGTNIGVAWTDAYQGKERILFSLSMDGGQNFFSPVVVSDPLRFSSEPQVVFGSGVNPPIYIVWSDIDAAGNNSDIYFSPSLTNGASFSSPVNLSINGGTALHPRMTFSTTNSNTLSTLSVVWEDNSVGEIFYLQSLDGGTSFSPPAQISSATAVGHQALTPDLVQSGSNLTIVWAESQSGIHLVQSNDNGATFSSPLVSPSQTTSYPQNPRVSLSSIGIYLVWEETDSLASQVRMTVPGLPVSGISSFPSSQILSLSGTASHPTVTYAAATNTLVVAWVDLLQQKSDNNIPQSEIFLIFSPDGGANFSPPANFSSPFQDASNNPELVNDGTNIFMVWDQQMPPSGSLPQPNGEVFFSHF